MSAAVLPCSTVARERGDPLLGTAPPARRWLLLEQDGGWGPNALASARIDPQVQAEIAGLIRAQPDVRFMLIRRPLRRASSTCDERAWCVVDTTAEQPLTWGTWSYPGDVLQGVEQLAAGPADDLALPRPPTAQPELLLVCTHGRKDVCCAVRGRPVAAELARRWPEATWECSHSGGDRFAANLVSLPDGTCYGQLDPHLAGDLVARHHTGETSVEHLRGVCGLPRTAQAAVVEAHRRYPELRAGQVTVLGSHRSGAATEVLVGAGAEELVAVVTERVGPPHRLTCQAQGASPMIELDVRFCSDELPSDVTRARPIG